jgi:hypothetical protein
MMRALNHELSKLFKSGTFKIALAAGTLLALVHFGFTVYYVKWAYYDNLATMSHPAGLDNISLLYRFLGCDICTVSNTLFYLALPILTALPYGASLYWERKSGYQLQVISRVGKKKYLAAKFITAFISGFVVICSALTLDLMLCAVICPLSGVHILSLEMPMSQGHFCVGLFYSAPVLFLIAAILMSSVWGGVCATLSMAAETFIGNAVIIVLFPFLLSYIAESLAEYLNGTLFRTYYEIKPFSLFGAVCLNKNPAWYVAAVQLEILAISLTVYFRRGLKRENL